MGYIGQIDIFNRFKNLIHAFEIYKKFNQLDQAQYYRIIIEIFFMHPKYVQDDYKNVLHVHYLCTG